MRKWLDLFESPEPVSESFFNAFDASGGYVEIFLNPTAKEFTQVFNHKGGARGFLDVESSEPKLYVWDSYIATHEDVDVALGLWGQRCEWFEPGVLVIYWNWDDDGMAERFQDFSQVREWLLSLPEMRRIGMKEVRRG